MNLPCHLCIEILYFFFFFNLRQLDADGKIELHPLFSYSS